MVEIWDLGNAKALPMQAPEMDSDYYEYGPISVG